MEINGLVSVSVLKPKLDDFFERKNIDTWDWFSPSIKHLADGNLQHVVVLADALWTLTPHYPWPKGSFHFWTLSEVMQKILCEKLGLDKRFVSIIPRYELFPAAPPCYTWSEVECLVYAGRDVFGKNLDLIREFSQKIKLPLLEMGPGLENDLGTDWTTKIQKKCALILLSHYIYEDFSVSAAQAQMHGMPILKTNWFALKEIQGPEVIGLTPHPEILIESEDRIEILKQWGKEFVERKNDPFPHPYQSPKKDFISTDEIIEHLKKMKDASLELYFFYRTNARKYQLDGFSDLISYLA